MRKYLVWVMMGLLVFSSLNSGCGGSSSSGGSSTQEGNGGTEQEQQQQQGTPTTPNTPTSQDSTPTSQDNTATSISFSVLAGMWKASNGTGTVTGSGFGSRTLSLSTRHNNTISFDVNVSGDTATLSATSDIYMDISGTPPADWDEDEFTWEDDFGGEKAAYTGVLEFRNTSGNTWRMDRVRHTGTPTYTIITLTSSTTAQVERYDEYETQIRFSYTLTKQ